MAYGELYRYWYSNFTKPVPAHSQPGELTDKGRATTLALGERLRHLYIKQLGFMPKIIKNSDMIYLRSTPLPRALESMQQVFWGMYPLSARTADFPEPTIITRSPADETLYPNDGNCRRFAQLSRAFAERTAKRWNDSSDMAYLNKLIGKWMAPGSPRVAVDSHPRLSGIMDTINATAAHGAATRLPSEFYDPKARDIIDRISVEEWFSGYKESNEYRTVGIGALAGDIVTRAVGSAERSVDDGIFEAGGENQQLGQGRGGESQIRFTLSGCHDTTLAALLSSLGAFEGEKWPPFTSHIAIELFKKADTSSSMGAGAPKIAAKSFPPEDDNTGLLRSILGRKDKVAKTQPLEAAQSSGIGRKPLSELSPSEKDRLLGYFVRIRYNDRVMTIPGCKPSGKHLDGDETFCTLVCLHRKKQLLRSLLISTDQEAFKGIVDRFTPRNWRVACAENIDQPAFPP
jgi:acid phosphatase